MQLDNNSESELGQTTQGLYDDRRQDPVRNRSLSICWLTPGLEASKHMLESAIRDTWLTTTDLNATFLSECPFATEAQNIAYGLIPFSMSADGTGGAANSSHGGFGAAVSRPRLDYLGIHEFGHVLGFDHEQSSDGAPQEACRKRDCDRDYSSSASTRLQCMADAAAQEGGYLVTEFDSNSVMNYCTLHSTGLSRLDIEGAQALFGVPRAARGVEMVASTIVRGTNRIDTFTRTSRGSVLHKYFDGQRWLPSGEGEDIGGELLSTPQVVSSGPDVLDIVGVGTDRALWLRQWNGDWWPEDSWLSLGGDARGTPAIVSPAPGRIDVFVRGEDASIYHKARINGRWFPSETTYEDLQFQSAGPVVAVSTNGRLHVFSVALTDRSVHVLESNDAGVFPPQAIRQWHRIGGRSESAPSVVVRNETTMELEVTISDDGRLMTAWSYLPLSGGRRWTNGFAPSFMGDYVGALEARDSSVRLSQGNADTRRFQVVPDGGCFSKFFLRREDGQVYSRRRAWFGVPGCGAYPNESAWNPDPGGTSDGTPSVAGSATGTTESVVVVRGTEGELWAGPGRGLTWGGWESLTDNDDGATSRIAAPHMHPSLVEIAPRPAPLTNLAAASTVTRGSDRIDTFATGGRGNVIHKYFDGSEWLPSGDGEDLGGELIGAPVAIVTGPDSIDIVGVGADLSLWHKQWLDGEWIPSQTGWTPLYVEARGMPALVASRSGRLDIFVRGDNDGLRHLTRLPNGTWNPINGGAFDLGGRSLGPVAALRTGTRLHVFTVGTNGSVWRRQSDDTGWFRLNEGWEDLGGTVAAGTSPAAIAFSPDSPNSGFAVVVNDGNTFWVREWNGEAWTAGFRSMFSTGLVTRDRFSTAFASPALVSSHRCYFEVLANTWDGYSMQLYSRAWPAAVSRFNPECQTGEAWRAAPQVSSPWQPDPAGGSDGTPSAAAFANSSPHYNPAAVVVVRGEDGALWARRQITSGLHDRFEEIVVNRTDPLVRQWHAWERLGGFVAWPTVPVAWSLAPNTCQLSCVNGVAKDWTIACSEGFRCDGTQCATLGTNGRPGNGNFTIACTP